MADIFDLFKKIEKKDDGGSNAPISWVVAGLGNIGKEYEGTRHNVGFDTLDDFSDEKGFKINKVKFKSYCGEYTVNGKRVLFIKPTTFMNLSGEAVKEAMSFYKLEPKNFIVVVDDVNLAPGKVRIRQKGSAGGHNGLKNIIMHLGTEEFTRVRIGVGVKPNPDYDMAKWVLSRPCEEDAEAIKEGRQKAIKAIPLLIEGEIAKAMNSLQ